MVCGLLFVCKDISAEHEDLDEQTWMREKSLKSKIMLVLVALAATENKSTSFHFLLLFLGALPQHSNT